jgi:hypothetical protein
MLKTQGVVARAQLIGRNLDGETNAAESPANATVFGLTTHERQCLVLPTTVPLSSVNCLSAIAAPPLIRTVALVFVLLRLSAISSYPQELQRRYRWVMAASVGQADRYVDRSSRWPKYFNGQRDFGDRCRSL